MSDNTKFWLGLWVIVGLAFSYLVFATSSYYTDKNTKVVEMIKGGADPIEVMCMLEDPAGNNPTCILKLTKEESK